MFNKKIITGCEARGDANEPYLTRWELITCKWFRLYLHKFHRSDADDALHNHPWNFYTFVISPRGYVEEYLQTPENPRVIFVRLVKGLRLHYRKATHTHRVVLFSNKPVWTIVLTGKYIRYWEFLDIKTRIFKNFRDYFFEKGC